MIDPARDLPRSTTAGGPGLHLTADGAGCRPHRRAPWRRVYVRTVYAPTLVAWSRYRRGRGLVALGPREVYVPSYPVSSTYMENINISNTVVNRTVVTNVYNTAIVNHNFVNVTYVNRNVSGAVVTTSSAAFASGQPVLAASISLPLDRQTLSVAQVQA